MAHDADYYTQGRYKKAAIPPDEELGKINEFLAKETSMDREVIYKPGSVVYKEPSALDSQVGGEHYVNLKIQPMEYSMANHLDACQHTAIKYITRRDDKGDPMEQIDKAIHTLQLMKELLK